MMLKRKEKHYHHQSLKLNNPNASAKTYWSILKSFYNDTKVPLIPPLLVNNKIASDFTKKANLFNDFFATQCTTLTNSSVLPSTTSFKTQSRLNSISFEKEDILNNYRPVSLLPICGKIFERIIYSPVYNTWKITSCLLHINPAFALMTLHISANINSTQYICRF